MTDTPENKQTRDENQRDFNAEIAGLPIGRMSRFLSSDMAEQISDQKNGKDKHQMSLLELLMLTDPRYAELYNDTVALIGDIDRAINKTLDDFHRNLQVLEANLSNIRGNANELSDGTRIYLSANGNIYTEDGEILSKAESANIEWRDDHPSWEEYTHVKSQLERTRSGITEVETYRDTVLQDAKDDLHDSENPLDYDDVQELRDHAYETLPSSVQNNLTITGGASPASELADQFSLKMSGDPASDTEKPDTTTETLTQDAGGSSFLSNFTQKL